MKAQPAESDFTTHALKNILVVKKKNYQIKVKLKAQRRTCSALCKSFPCSVAEKKMILGATG